MSDPHPEDRRLRTLFVSPYSPYPLIFGGAIRVYNLMRTFAEFSDVSVICMHELGDLGADRELPTWCDEVVFVEPPGHHRALRQVRSIVDPRRSFLTLDHRSDRFQAELDELLARCQFDVIVVEHTQMAQYDLGDTGAVDVLDLHNIEHELVQRRSEVSTGVRSWALRWEAAKVRREELRACRDHDLVFTTSDREAHLLREWVPDAVVETVPNSIDPARFGTRETAAGGRELLFVGATHVDANRDGVRWFVEEVYPLVRERIGDVELKVVGGAPPPDIRRLHGHDGVEVVGFVPDVGPYFDAATVSIVPLRTGGGTRLKVLESMAAGVPTVSTSIGAEGLDLADGTELLLADEPDDFAAAIVRVLESTALQAELAAAGRRVVDERYSWRAQRERVERAIRAQRARTDRQR